MIGQIIWVTTAGSLDIALAGAYAFGGSIIDGVLIDTWRFLRSGRAVLFALLVGMYHNARLDAIGISHMSRVHIKVFYYIFS